MIRKGLLLASFLLATPWVANIVSHQDKKIEISNLLTAYNTLSVWTDRLNKVEQKRKVATAARPKIKKISTKEIVNVQKIEIAGQKVEFKNLIADSVSRKAYARRRSIIKPLTLELKTLGEEIRERVEFSNPIEKRFKIEAKDDQENLQQKSKLNQKKKIEIEEIKSYEIVEVKSLKIETVKRINVASLLDSVEIEKGVKLVAYLEKEKSIEEKSTSKPVVEKIIEDKVETKLAASIKIDDLDSFPINELNTTLEAETKELEKIEKEEAVKEEKVVAQIPASSSISKNVADVINRELEKPIQFQRVVSTQTAKPVVSFNLDKDRREYSSCESGKKIEIFAYEAGGDDLTNFEISPSYDDVSSDERLSAASGVVSVCKDIADEYSTMPILVRNEGMVATSAVVSFGDNHGQLNVPMMSAERMDALKRDYSVADEAGAILIEMYGNLEDVTVDSSNSVRIELNESFEEIQEASETVAFVLFLNVESRNNLIKYRFAKSHVEKIAFVGPGEVFYDDPDFREGNLERIELVQRNLVGTLSTELGIEKTDLGLFGQDVEIKKPGLNVFEYLLPRIPYKMRKYIELKHLDRTVFAGYGQQEKMEIPSGEYVEYSLSKLGIDPSMELQCAIQINIDEDKDILAAKIGGRDARGSMYLNVIYQDKDGNYYKDPSETTVKILIGAELSYLSRQAVATGSIAVKIEYADHTNDYLQSFCSDKTYLVEQL